MVAVPALALALSLSGVGDAVLLEFSADWCGACKVAEPTVRRLIAEGYPVRQVNVDKNRQLASDYRVTLVPCFVLVADGREVGRLTGGAGIDQLRQLFSSAGYRPGNAAPPAAPAVQPVSLTGPPRPVYPPPGAQAPAAPQVAGPAPGSPSPSPSPSTSPSTADPQLALQSTVRIRIDDPNGQSVGTGTIIDIHDGEALIITCGHLFRDSAGKGLISVDLFVPGATRPVRGQLIGYDLDRDIGFVSIVPGIEVRPVRVAPQGYPIARGDGVFTIGCNKGNEPSVMTSQVTAIDKYLGAPNIEVAGQPIDGRSGGGLFSRDGFLIGVCNAADPADKEGIYAGLKAIHWQLDQIGQRSIYQPQFPPSQLAEDSTSRSPEPPRRDSPPPQIPPSMVAPEVRPVSNPQPGSTSEISELICIVRGKNDPQGSERLFILSRPSPDLLRQLMLEARPMDQQRAPGEIRLQAVSEPRGPADWAGQRTDVTSNSETERVVRAQSNDR